MKKIFETNNSKVIRYMKILGLSTKFVLETQAMSSELKKFKNKKAQHSLHHTE